MGSRINQICENGQMARLLIAFQIKNLISGFE